MNTRDSSASIVCLVFALVVYWDPYLYNVAYPHLLVHDYRRSQHPPSPHTPPRRTLQRDILSKFERDRFVVVRDLFTEAVKQKMNTAYEDLAANQTRGCAVSQWAGSPTFGRYDMYCAMADLVHDYLRDAVYHSPMAHVASQLMSNLPTRLFRAHAMGAKRHTTLQEAWHVDYTYFPAPESCDNGIIFWVPLEESMPEGNGMKVIRNRNFEDIVQNGTFASMFHRPADLLLWMQQTGRSGETSGLSHAPRLNFGDALLFSKCLLHSVTGVNKLGRARRSLQFRFAVGAGEVSSIFHGSVGPISDFFKNSRNSSEISDHGSNSEMFGDWTTPLLWPETLPREDAVRADGPHSMSRLSLLQLRLDRRWLKHWVLVNNVYFIHVFLWKHFGLDVDLNDVAAVFRKVRQWLAL